MFAEVFERLSELAKSTVYADTSRTKMRNPEELRKSFAEFKSTAEKLIETYGRMLERYEAPSEFKQLLSKLFESMCNNIITELNDAIFEHGRVRQGHELKLRLERALAALKL